MPTLRTPRYKVVLAFGLVYFFWGATYLAISVAVHRIPPEAMTSIRYLTAGPLILAWCAASGRRIRLRSGEALRLAVIGILLLCLGNTGVSISELYLSTGLAALIVACVPLWFLLIEVLFVRRQQMTQRSACGLALGAIGMVVLLWPQLRASGGVASGELWASLGLVMATLAWATGSVLSAEWRLDLDAFSATAWEIIFAGIVNLAIAGVRGDFARAQWSVDGLVAVAYQIVFGSCVGFSAYIWLLHHVPTAKVATYAYVNPVIAVFLGWIFLHERVDGYILTGAAIVLSSVAITTTAKVKRRKGRMENEVELPAVEGVG